MYLLELWKQLRADQRFLGPQKKKKLMGDPGVHPKSPKMPIWSCWKIIWLCQLLATREEIFFGLLARDKAKGPVFTGRAGTGGCVLNWLFIGPLHMSSEC